MNQEEMIKDYEQELRAAYEEMRDAFGASDSATQNAFREWLIMDELLNRLNLQDEK
jgi:hypothetical protein